MKKHISLFALGVALVFAQPAAAQHSLNVRDADVRAFIEDAAQVTGRTFIIDGRVQGKVSVVTDRPLSRSEYFEVFLSTLRANGLIAVPTANGAYRIQPTDGAASAPGRVGSRGAQNEFVTEVFRLRAIDATTAVETLRPLVSREGSITANRSGNSLVVADYADNIRRIRALIGQIDRDNATTQVITLSHAGAREIAMTLQQLAPAPGGGAEGGGGAPLVSVVAVDSSNSVALRGDAPTVARLTAIAKELDARAANGSEIRVIWLDYADAEQLVPVLQMMVGAQGGGAVTPMSATPAAAPSANGTAPAAASAPVGGAVALSNGRGQAIITRYEGANAVIISAPVDVQRSLAELVRQLDIRQEQVLVEAIIVEISDRVARELGVQFLIGGKDIPFLVTPFSNVTPNILDIAGGLLADELDETTTVINGNTVTTSNNSAVGNLLRQNAAQSILGARGGYSGFAADIGSNRVLGAIINAVQEDSESNILSTPSLTVNDNVKGSILFGQEIPISTGEALSNNFDNAFRTIQRQNVGIELEVKPQINAGNQVKLDIRQEVSSIVGPVSDDFNELIINKREVKTTVTVKDREIIALGGLLDDNERRTLQKIPLLGDIPILGELFKSRGKQRTKTNLMVFIRPTILRTAADAQAIAARRYNYVRAAQIEFDPKAEPSLDKIVLEYLGANVPVAPPAGPNDQVVTPRAMPGTAPIDSTTLPPSQPAQQQQQELPPTGGQP
ncbi:MAG: type II secretion system protein GspD [Sphingomonadales bacterium RIFCSPHIGHO2_01_FULL_65_20]|uniref:type II secretion system secretin GspD n=1 Tax=unclassified Blastomonas TaxID=2626550 RepID=UPI00082A6D4C|nr:type II secretion system secretin GspD [Blastomonas sp.]MCH2237863.1 type II secretion system secretin GspD [Blastomonas sp.]OHC97264.1 MAG: type II secretion system protein GspD [Sphingomonadales bacterium RIFCSPHIGHO2_01_FULL_65_20]